jgi:hypothetical protein
VSRCDWPDGYEPLYRCGVCCLDFVSEDAFNRHRVGTHEYDWSLDRPDGRRCLDVDELASVGLALLDGDALAGSQYASRARFGVPLVYDPAGRERARAAFSRHRERKAA